MAAVANIPDHCVDKYLVDAQIATINDSLDKYTETISKGYDSKFKIYAEHIKELVPLQLIAYMAGAQASGFFTCTTTEYQLCCGSTCCPAEDHCICPAVPCNPSQDCQKGLQTKTVNCPTSIPLATDQAPVDKIAYTCTNIDGFKADVAQKYGIDPSWIVFGDYTARINGGCWQSNCDAIQSRVIWSGFPVPAASFSVPDPKDLISGTYDNTRNLAAQLTGKEEWIDDNYEGLMLSDLVDASSVPALM
ncbi:MAG: hypothetical protein CL912_28290 [Deltaproteobacteria bacterium]|nr:hypothetical protein [Deltaproteobacteria bacterium]